MKKRWFAIVLLSIAALLFSAIFVLHRLAENRINEAGVLAARIQQLESETGYTLKHGAVRFEFLRGMVLTGISLSGKNAKGEDVPLLTGGQAVLGFPVLSIISLNPSPDRLTIHEGHVFLKNLSGAMPPGDRFTSVVRFLKKSGLELRLANLQIEDLAEQKDVAARDLRLKLTVRHNDQSGASLKGELQYQDRSVLHFYGPWKEEPQERIYLRLESMPVRLPFQWSSSLPYIPEGIDVSLSDGELNGEGSIDITKEGFALNLHGNYEDVSFTLPGFRKFEAKKLKGEYDQMIVGSYAKGVLHSRLKLRSDLLDHSTDIDTDQPGHSIRYTLKGSLHLKPEGNLTLPVPVVADVDYQIGLDKKIFRDREALKLSVDAKLKRLEVSLNQAWPSIPALKITNGIIKGDGPIGFAFPGTLGSTEFQLGGRITPDLYRVENETRFKHTTDFTLDIKEASLHDIVHAVDGLSEDMLKYVKGPDAVQVEDSGPIWENKFTAHPLYRRFIEPAVVTGQIRLLHLKDTSPDMPASLSLQFRHRVPATELLLQPLATDSTKVDGHYRVLYDATLPQHEARFEVHYAGSGYVSRALCDEKTPVDPVQSVDLKYTYVAEGMYLADLYFKSVTGLFLKIKHLPVANNDRAELIRRLAEVEPPGLRYVDLEIENHSAGSLFKPIILKVEDGDTALVGTGEFNVYEGGFMKFQSFSKQKGRQGQFGIRIRSDRVWIPFS